LLFAQIKTIVVNAFKWNCIFNLLHAISSSFDFFLAFEWLSLPDALNYISNNNLKFIV
jgi:hypothetical protein